MSESIKTKAQDTQEFFTELLVSIGRAELMVDKGLLEEPNLTNVPDALNDIDAIISANFGKTEGSVLGQLADLKEILDDGVA